eukprot:12135957-Heterocapsa_arctica.AAC.1
MSGSESDVLLAGSSTSSYSNVSNAWDMGSSVITPDVNTPDVNGDSQMDDPENDESEGDEAGPL